MNISSSFTHLKKLFVFFLLSGSFPLVIHAQDSLLKSSLEVGLGLNVWTPATNQMLEIMKTNGFDITQPDNHIGSNEYPKHAPFPGFSLSFAYYHHLNTKSQLGLSLGYTQFRGVVGNPGSTPEFGYSNQFGQSASISYHIHFSSTSLALLYRYQFLKYIELQAGPLLINNQGEGSWGYLHEPMTDKYEALTPALLLGFSLRGLEWKNQFFKTNLNYILSPKASFGAFHSPTIENPAANVPASQIKFSQLNFQLIYGTRIAPQNHLFEMPVYKKKYGGNLNLYLFAGAGYPDLFFVAGAIQFKQAKIGASRGAMFCFRCRGDEFKSVFFQYHWGGESKYTQIKPWYARVAFGMDSKILGRNPFKEYFFPIRIGREINFSRNIGVFLEGGNLVSVRLSRHTRPYLGPRDPLQENVYFWPMGPILSGGLFFRLF